MKNVVFFTPNQGMESAAEFIFTTLNTGGPQRFNKIDFGLIDENAYDTHYRAGTEDLFVIETKQVIGEKNPEFFLVLTLRIRSFNRSSTVNTFVPLSKKGPRFPTPSGKWQEKMRVEFGHGTTQDLWDNLLQLRKIRRIPL